MATYVSKYPPAHSDSYVKATSTYSTSYPYQATDPSKSLIGSFSTNSWLSGYGSPTQRKFNIDLGEPIVPVRLYIENSHHNGSYTNRGAKDVSIYGTNSATAFANTVYSNTDELTWIADIQIAQHVSSDVSDPQYFVLTNTASYRYLVLRIHNSWGDGYVGLRRIEVQYDADSGGGGSFRLVHDLYYSNLTERFLAVLDHYYHLFAGFRKEQAHIYGLRMCIEHALYYGSMPTFRRAFSRSYTNAPHLRKVFDRLYHDLARFTVEAERGYDIRGGLRMVQELSYMIAGAGFRLELPHHYELMEYDRFRKAFARLYAIAGAGSVTQKPVHTVRIGSALLAGVKVINVSALREQDVIVAEVQTTSQADALLAVRWAEEVVTIGDDVYQLVVSRKPRRARTTEAADTWVITASSPAVLMDRDVLVRKFEPGWASVIAAELAAPYGVSVSWEIVDWLVPADTLFANNESPLAVIDKLARAGGGIKQSAPDGTLRIIPAYPVSVNRWGTAEPEFIISDLYDLFSHDDEGDERAGYNSFVVSNLLSASQNAWLEYVDLTGTRKEIRGYDVPRVDGRRFWVTSSGGPWVSVEPMGEVEEVIEEQVELFGGVGRLSKPCYGLLSVDWRQRQLGWLIPSEDGTVQAEEAGASLALVRYTTRYWRWLARNARVEDVQFVREVEDAQPA